MIPVLGGGMAAVGEAGERFLVEARGFARLEAVAHPRLGDEVPGPRKDQPHHVFDWAVPLRVDGRKVALRGSLDYDPPPESGFNPLLIAPLAAFAFAGAGVWWWRKRQVRA